MFSNQSYPFVLLILCCLGMASQMACDTLRTDIDLEAERFPVVECYLEVGQPIRLTLSESQGFFAAFDTTKEYWEQLGLIPNAEVVISGNGITETLRNQLFVDPHTNRIFNYTTDRVLPEGENVQYSLSITLSNGESIKAETMMLSPVPIDSMIYTYSEDIDRLARVITFFNDPPQHRNFYQYILRYDRKYDTLPRQNFPFPDDYFSSSQIAMVGTYDLRRNQEAIATLAHINEDYHDFLRSTNLAILGSQNPVILPAQIQSNLTGSADAIGIFTALAIERDTIKVK